MSVDRSRSVSDALAAAGRVLVDYPAAVLPAYLLALGALPAARTPLLVALAAAVGLLVADGRIEAVVRAFADAERDAATPGGDGFFGGFGETPSEVTLTPEQEAALSGLATPEVGVLLLAGLLATVVAALVLRAVALAVTYGTVWAALDGRDPLVGGVRASGRWSAFLGLLLLRAALAVVLVGVPLVITATLAAASLGGAALLGVPLVGGGVLLALVAFLLLSFANAAVVVGGVGALTAARLSVRFVREHLAATLGFVLVSAGVSVGVGALFGVLNLVGVTRVGAVLLPLLVAPVLDTFTTALYAGGTLPGSDRPGAATRVRRTVRRGWAELVGFVEDHPVAVVAAHGILFGAVAAGYAVTARYGVRFAPPGDVANVFGAVPVGTFVTLWANNWFVAASSAYGGLAVGLPVVASLGLNGALVGALGGVFDPTAFLALVAPHGVIELPALALAGALGLHLGVVGWRGVRGRTDADAVGDELLRAAYALVGVALLLLLAAFIEAFLTPRIAAWILA